MGLTISEEFTDANSDLLRLRSNDFCTDPAQKALSVVMNWLGSCPWSFVLKLTHEIKV